jgi:hypothetical protein
VQGVRGIQLNAGKAIAEGKPETTLAVFAKRIDPVGRKAGGAIETLG